MSKHKGMESSSAPVHQNGGFGSSFGFVLACVVPRLEWEISGCSHIG